MNKVLLLGSPLLAVMSSIAMAQTNLPSSGAEPSTETTTTEKKEGAPETRQASETRQSSGSQDIVVTARRREERLIDVPMSASVVTGGDLLNRGSPADTQSLLTGVAGLNFRPSTSSSLGEVSIRGSGTNGSGTGDSGVALYRNGLFVTGGLFFGRNFTRADFFDVERVEVLRGTQGALYGRNAVGGAINILNTQPKFESSGRIDLNHAFDINRNDLQVVVNQPLSDTFAIRVGADLVRQTKGYVYNRSFDNYIDRESGFVLRAQARFHPDKLDIDLLVERQEDKPALNYAQLTIAPTPPNFPLGYTSTRYNYVSSVQPYHHADTTNVMLIGTYDLGFAQFSVNGLYRKLYADQYFDQDLFTDATLAATRAAGNPARTTDSNANMFLQVHTKWYNLETHLSGEIGNLHWLAGIDYLRLDGDLIAIRSRTPGFMGSPATLALNSFSTEHWISAASYASLEYSFIPKVLGVTGELRYTHDAKDLVLDAPVRYFRRNNLSYTITANYHPIDNVLIYLKNGTGYRVGGANAGPIIPSPPAPIPTPVTYNNETTREFELGLRGEPTRSLNFALAAYRTTIKGAILSQTNGCTATNACGVVVPAFLDNLGGARVWGVEMEGGLNLRLLGGSTSSRVSLSRQQGELKSGIFTGAKVPQTPKWIASANINYIAPISATLNFFLNANYQAQWGGIQALGTPVFPIDDRQLINLRAGVRTHGIELTAYVNNIFNDEFRLASSATTSTFFTGRRTFGLQARYTW